MKKASPFIYLWWLAGSSLYSLCCYLLLPLMLLSDTFVPAFLKKLFIWGGCRLRAREGQLQRRTMSSLTDARACAYWLPMANERLSFSPPYTKVNIPPRICNMEELPVSSCLPPCSGVSDDHASYAACSEGFWNCFFYSERNSIVQGHAKGDAFMSSAYGGQVGVFEHIVGMGPRCKDAREQRACSTLHPCKWRFPWLQCRPITSPCSARLSQLLAAQAGCLGAGSCTGTEARLAEGRMVTPWASCSASCEMWAQNWRWIFLEGLKCPGHRLLHSFRRRYFCVFCLHMSILVHAS